MKIIATLEALHSKADTYGNRYWAFRFICHETGQIVEGKSTGGESNIYAIKCNWNVPDGWDDSIRFEVRELGIRDFNRLTKDWTHAGCSPDELASFVRKQLENDDLQTQAS